MYVVKKGSEQMQLERDLRKLRMYEDLTLEEVGDKLDMPRQRIYAIEKNMNGTSFGTVIKVFNAIGYDLELVKLEKEG